MITDDYFNKYVEVVKKQGGACLSQKPSIKGDEISWLCSEGHKWKASLVAIRGGANCYVCARYTKTISDMNKMASLKNGACLSDEYKGDYIKLRWRCSFGHEWDVSPKIIGEGKWCPHCAKKSKLTIDDAIYVAKEKGGTVLDKEYVNSYTKMEWMCGLGHVWYARYNDVKRGSWCPDCKSINAKNRKNKPITISRINDEAERRGGFCADDNYKPGEKINLECSMGHKWESNIGNFFKGKWCPDCYGNRKMQFDEIIAYAKSKGGVCLSKSGDFVKRDSRLMFECKNGHIWESSWGSQRTGCWCQECAVSGRSTITIDDAIRVANENFGKCLSKEYMPGKNKLKWECKFGHTWLARYDQVVSGNWCPDCNIWKSQKRLSDIICDILSTKEIHNNYRGFDWLKTDAGGKQEIDIYVPELKLAIEYDGEQHFMPVNFGGRSKERSLAALKETQRLDALKNKKIANNPDDVEYFVRFNHKEKITESYVREKLVKIGAINAI